MPLGKFSIYRKSSTDISRIVTAGHTNIQKNKVAVLNNAIILHIMKGPCIFPSNNNTLKSRPKTFCLARKIKISFKLVFPHIGLSISENIFYTEPRCIYCFSCLCNLRRLFYHSHITNLRKNIFYIQMWILFQNIPRENMCQLYFVVIRISFKIKIKILERMPKNPISEVVPKVINKTNCVYAGNFSRLFVRKNLSIPSFFVRI